MSRAIRIHEAGGPEVMHLEDIEVSAPGAGEIQVRHSAVGLNYIDVYDRTGLYPQPLPAGLGREAAGRVTALGKKTRGFRVGDRVAYVHSTPGSYCELRNVPAVRLVKIPAGVSDEQAAVLMLKGMTACFLLRHCFRVEVRRGRRPCRRGRSGLIGWRNGPGSGRGGHRRGGSQAKVKTCEDQRLQTRA